MAGRYKPNRHLRSVAAQYNKEQKLPPLARGHYFEVDPDFGTRTAHEYEKLPVEPDDKSREAYDAFSREIDQQHEHLTKHGYVMEPSEQDPYPASGGKTKMELAAEDVRKNKHLSVFSGSAEHPYLSTEQNVKFRGVHDLFGHLTEGFSIGPRGEYNAAAKHSQMFSPTARKAMLSETHGQNSVVNFSDTVSPEHGRSIAEVNREKPGTIYADQKAHILPDSIYNEFHSKLTRSHPLFRRFGK